MSYSKKERQEAIDDLKKYYLKPGDTVYLSLSRVSRSGMSRVIKCLTNDHCDISHLIACACDYPNVRNGYLNGVRVTGCGMDMGLALVDTLSYALFNKPCDQGDNNGGLRYRWL